ncbi:MAG TPA: autotransporter-associated beta strand repeat-containing protein, partial [Pyrinomonadaceae bacterium]|nr:autotransporter-associated beta strand repeat-containing protein [Pyrinomonadaceae bacterium]
GTVSISTGTNLGAAPGSPVANQVTINGGTLATTGTFTFAANRGTTLGASGGTIDVASATTVTAAQIITGSGSLTKTSAGTLTLSGDNTYTGTTTVSAGTLLVNGSQSSSAVSLNGGILGGAGTMGAVTSTASGGSLAPGSGGPGLLNSGNVNLSTGSPSFVVELNGTTAGSGYDQLNVTGTVNLTGASLSGTVGFTPAIGSTFTIINNDSTDAVTGTFAGLSEGSNIVLSGYNFTISYTGGTGNDVVLTRAATTFTWDGGGGDNNWTTAANWVGDVAPTVGDSLVFDATGVGTRPSPNSDFANGTSFGSITVSMGGYTLGGNSVSLTTGLTVSNASGSSTVSQVMDGAGTVTKTDGGTLTLSAANTYTGATNINGGVVSIAADNNLGTVPGSPTVGQLTFGGGTLQTTATFTLSSNRGIAFNSPVTIDVASSTTLTYGGIAAGAGELTKTSAGTLTLSGANTYTGTTTISAGVVNIQNATALGTTAAGTTVASGARLEVQGDIAVGAEALTINGTGGGSGALLNVSGSNSWAGAITLGSASTIGSTAGTLTGTGGITNGGFLLTVAGAGNTTLSTTAISGTGGLTKTDGGTLTLSAANTYTGATDINGGVVSIAADNNLGTAPGSPTVGQLTFGGGTLQTTATFTLSSNRGIAFNSTGTIDVASSATLTYGGIGAGSGGLTKTSDGTLTLSGANTYTGMTTVSAGTLLVNGSQSGSEVSVNGGTLGGTVTVGMITSTSSGGTISVGSPASNPGILNSGNVNWSSGSPTFVVQLNGTTAGSGYDQLNVTGTVNLTGATLSASLGFTPAGGTQLTIINNDGTDAVVGTFSGLAEGATVTLNGVNFTISYVGGTGNDVVLTTGTPSVGLVKSVDPSGSQPPETDLAYTVTFTNSGSLAAQSLVITDPIPANTDFKVGSVTSSLGTTALTVAVTYSNDGGTTWMYTPVSGGGGAPAGYDRSVTNIHWTFTGNLSQTSPNNTGSVSFIARIR